MQDRYEAALNRIAGKYRIPVFTHEGGGIGRDWNEAYDLAETKLVMSFIRLNS